MALTATSGTTAAGLSTSATVPLTITDAPNQTLYVAVYWDELTSGDLGGVTYNSVALTQIAELGGIDAGANYLWVGKLVNPSTGAEYNIVVNPGVSRAWRVLAVICEDNDQTTPNDTPPTPYENTSSQDSTVTTTSASGDLVLSFAAINNMPIANITRTGSGQTLINEADGGDGAGYLGASYTAGAASVVTGWHSTSLRQMREIAFNVNVAVQVPTNDAKIIIAPAA